MGNIIVGIIFIIGGVSGTLALRGTNSPMALAAVGVGLCIWGFMNPHDDDEKKGRSSGKPGRKGHSRSAKRTTKKPVKNSEVEEFIAGSSEGLKLATEAHQKAWHLGEEEKWDVDQDKGIIIFTFSNGVKATAPVQIIGTYNNKDKSFMWGWEHPSVELPLQKNASLSKAYGEEHKVKEFTTKKVSCTLDRAWEYTALAMRLSGDSGAYRGESSPGTFVFLNFGKVTLVKKKVIAT